MLISTLFPLRSSLQSGSRQAPHSPPCGDGEHCLTLAWAATKETKRGQVQQNA